MSYNKNYHRMQYTLYMYTISEIRWGLEEFCEQGGRDDFFGAAERIFRQKGRVSPENPPQFYQNVHELYTMLLLILLYEILATNRDGFFECVEYEYVMTCGVIYSLSIRSCFTDV